MFEEFLEYVKAEELLDKGDAIVMGLSGGGDSVCLFLFLVDAAKQMDLKILAVHINHMIRGSEADEDERFVKNLCKKHNIPLKIIKENIPQIAKQRHLSLEEAGREIRRKAFVECGRAHFGKPFKIALAHHMDDNTETMLYRMARGTGIKGLFGISPKGTLVYENTDITVVHPLLIFDKEKIMKELKRRGESWREDSTNEDTSYARNMIRNEVVPRLKEVNAGLSEHMYNLSCDIGVITDYLRRQAKEAVREGIYDDGSLEASVLDEAEEALQNDIITVWLQRNNVSLKDFSRKHVKAVVDLVKKGVNSQVDVCGNKTCVLEYGKLYISEKESEIKDEKCSDEVLISTDMLYKDKAVKIKIDGWEMVFTVKKPLDVVRDKENPFNIYINYDKINDMCVRTRRQGDELVINRQGQKKRINRIMIDNRVPKRDRDLLPILTDGRNVIWICGVRQSMDSFVDEDTQTVLMVEARRIEGYE